METKLVPMTEFILSIDWMTTAEFCAKYKVLEPKWLGSVPLAVNDFHRVNDIKQKMFVEYAKFLRKKLTIDMFEGESKIFQGGEYKDIQPSTSWNYYTIKGRMIFQDRIDMMGSGNYLTNAPIGMYVEDLVGLDLTFNMKYPC